MVRDAVGNELQIIHVTTSAIVAANTAPVVSQPSTLMGAYEGIPAMGLDGFASSAYGPEAALTVLATLGAASTVYIGGCTAMTGVERSATA